MGLVAAVGAKEESATVVQPSEGPFDDPAVAAEPGPVLGIASGDQRLHSSFPDVLDRSAMLSLLLTVALALIYFAIGQGMGGVLTGSGTDPGTGPLLILLALAVYATRHPHQPSGPERGDRGWTRFTHGAVPSVFHRASRRPPA